MNRMCSTLSRLNWASSLRRWSCVGEWGVVWIGGAWLRLSPLEQLAAGAAGLACWYASGRLALAAGGDVPLVVAGMFFLSGAVLVWALRR